MMVELMYRFKTGKMGVDAEKKSVNFSNTNGRIGKQGWSVVHKYILGHPEALDRQKMLDWGLISEADDGRVNFDRDLATKCWASTLRSFENVYYKLTNETGGGGEALENYGEEMFEKMLEITDRDGKDIPIFNHGGSSLVPGEEYRRGTLR